MKKGRLIWYWDYELQSSKDVSLKPNKYTAENEVDNTNFILKKCKKANINFCFSVLGKTILNNKMPYSNQNQVKKIQKEGHEIACHTLNHRRLSISSYQEVYYDLKYCKELMKKKLNINCLTLTPPWNKPQQFFNIDFDINRKTKLIEFDVLSTKKICKILNSLGFLYYRLPCFSFNKIRLSHPKMINNITCIPLFNGCWISNIHFNLIRLAIIKRGLVILGKHPIDLSFKGEKDKFSMLLDFINEKVNQDKLEVVLNSNV